MSNLVFSGNVRSLTTSLQQSLSSLKEEKKALQEKARLVFLLDCSGSMSEYVRGERKIDTLRKVLKDYEECQKVFFNSNAGVISYIPEPDGRTDMALGFRTCQPLFPKRIILISDGLPDDEEEAIREAKALHVKVDVIYIGEGGDSGETFMRRLASECGGREITVDISSPSDISFSSQLKQSVAGLISYKK